MKCVICVGISGSGKSQWAEEFTRNRDDWVEINRDNLRFPDGNRDYYNYKFKKNKENAITEQANKAIEIAAKLEKNIIISDTNLNVGRRDALVEKLETFGYDVELKFFEITLDEAIKRDKQRIGGVSLSVIMRQWLQLKGESYKPKDGEKAVIFDVDGTVAKMEGRKPYEWHRVGEDSVITHVMDIAKALHRSGLTIIFLSGRDGVCQPETSAWLDDNFGSDYELFMREAGDSRRDSIIKKELFDENIRDWYNVQSVFDDRPNVIRECWLTMGVPVLSVGNPYIDF